MSFLEPSARVPLIISAPNLFSPRRVREPVSLADVLPTFCDIGSEGKSILARPIDGRSLYPLLAGAEEDPQATCFGEYLAEGAIAPIYMLRRGRWKFIRSSPIPTSCSTSSTTRTNSTISPQSQSMRKSPASCEPRSLRGSMIRKRREKCWKAKERGTCCLPRSGVETIFHGITNRCAMLPSNIRATTWM